jgi:hypothetical protein
MAVRVRINRFEVYRESMADARKLVDDVLDEVKRAAFTILITGPYTTGELAMGLETEVQVEGKKITGRVGISGRRHPHAGAVEGGARPHIITPRTKQWLKFYWRKVGKTVYFRSVHHPGQEGKAYLRGPLVRAALRHGMRVITHDVTIPS